MLVQLDWSWCSGTDHGAVGLIMVQWDWSWCSGTNNGAVGLSMVQWDWAWCSGTDHGTVRMIMVQWDWAWCSVWDSQISVVLMLEQMCTIQELFHYYYLLLLLKTAGLAHVSKTNIFVLLTTIHRYMFAFFDRNPTSTWATENWRKHNNTYFC